MVFEKLDREGVRRLALGAVLTCLVAAVAFSYGFAPIGDENDIWWHLKTGQMLCERGGWPPATDVFAYTSSDTVWHNHEWLSQVAMWQAYSMADEDGGLRLVIFVKALLLAATFLVVLRLAALRAGDITLAALLALAAISISRFSMHARPPVISFLFGAVYLWLLYGAYWSYDDRRVRWTRLGVAMGLMLLWVNLHGGFLMGLVLIALFSAGAFVDGMIPWLREGRREPFWQVRGVRMARDFAICWGACVFISFLNPSGVMVYGMFFRVMGDPALVASISELQPPPMGLAHAFEAVIIAFVVVGGLARRRLPSAVDYFLLVFFLHQSLLHVRHLPLFAITAIPILSWQLRGFYDDLKPLWRKYWRPAFAIVTVLAAVWLVSVRRPGKMRSALSSNITLARHAGAAFDPRGYPGQICDFLIANRIPGRMFNEVNFAGYLIWRLSPETHKVFTDSRFDIFSGDYLGIANAITGGIETVSGRQVWREFLDDWDINLIIIDGWKELNSRLKASGEWRLAATQPWSDGDPDQMDGRRCFNLWIRNEPRLIRTR